MGSIGDFYYNALAENLFSVLKTECVRRTAFATRTDADLALFAYIDGWYNPLTKWAGKDAVGRYRIADVTPCATAPASHA
ncbi:IS3 family transposase [Streptomyces vinaceus]|uniref:IS3 family transposase n=1 Tax=Streptomyces vinaceus TaxID=1960 RepID=UPI00381BD91C